MTSVGRDTERMSSRQHLQFSRTTTEIEQDADGKTAPAVPASFTGEPSAASKVTTAVFRVIRAVTGVLGLDFVTDIGPLIASESPPWFTTIGVKVRRSEFDGMPVVALGPPRPSGKYVVAVHGGAYVVKPTVFEWLQYASWARDTGATVLMPLYPLAPGGTARTVVPVIADLISNEIEQHGARNVSVTGTSAGGGIALTAVQELVRRGDQVPSHMVLSSPALDLTVSNPAIQFVDDPILTSTTVRRAQQWAGDLELTDPLVSPLYGSLAGLPPTAIYSGSLDLLAPDVLVLQDKAIATKGSDVTFVLRKDQLHAWAGIFWLPEAQALLPDIYRQLGLL
ncbi:alpha/beta hydrolase fold domain-containing protein [Mycobacterium sp. 4D054]|uniref:alpha/beta hydrolase fold domain-containing protein n=1 Tax=Mycobacterium sp. 4D054 TaxID=3457440 RepID=UPI003FD4E27E